MRSVARALAPGLFFVLLLGLEWEGSRARWLRELATGDETHRIGALHGLVPLPGADVDAALAGALGDAAADVRIEAALACETRHLRSCAPALADWLDDRDPDVRAVAARALGSTGDAATDTAQLARALGDARAQVRRAAVLGLGALGGPLAITALVTALSDADTVVRERACAALGATALAALETRAATSALLATTRDAAPEVRAAALDALGVLADPRAASVAMVALDDDVIEVRLAALRTLTRVPSSAATSALVSMSADDDRIGRAALAALAVAPDASAIDAMLSALARPSVARSAEDALEARMLASDASRVEVIVAMTRAIAGAHAVDRAARLASSASRLSLHVSIAGLEGALSDALALHVDPATLEALGRTGAEDALVPILDALASDDASMRSAALAGLEGLAALREPDGRILEPLSLALPRLDPDERARAVAIVGRARSDRAATWLTERLDDPARETRVAALRALRSRELDMATSRLAALLDDSDPETRTAAALALARHAPDPAVTAHLADDLVSDAPHDRHAILLALGPMVDGLPERAERERARAAIRQALRSEDPELADSAAHAVAASHDAALAHAALEVARESGATARALRALVGIDSDEARAFARAALDAADPVVATAAYVTLGEIGARDDGAEIARRAPGRFPVSASLAFALARMALRGVLSVDVAMPALSLLARAHDPYVRANVALAAARLGLTHIEGGPAALDWLASRASPIVEAAAARWAFAVRDSLDVTRLDALLATCAADATQPALARACAIPALVTETDVADVIALDVRQHPMANALVALRLADGSALVTYADARGRVRLERAPSGPLSLDAPESAVLVP